MSAIGLAATSLPQKKRDVCFSHCGAVTILAFNKKVLKTPIFITRNVTSVTVIGSTSARLFAGMWRPLVSVIRTLNYVAIIFHRRVWYRALSLCYLCIRSSGTIHRCAKFCFSLLS